MAKSERNIKLLWGRAAGYCSNPECRIKLSTVENKSKPFLIGEMAHIVARKIGGPRADDKSGEDTYDNLILLCPNCHTMIDKDFNNYLKADLLDWKIQHENWVVESLEGIVMSSKIEMASKISTLLSENKYFFLTYGPKSDVANKNPDDSQFALWLGSGPIKGLH